MPNEDPTSGPLSDVFLEADPEMAAFMARHTALLERVTVLERVLEQFTAACDDFRGRGKIVPAVFSDADRAAREALNG